MSYEIIPAGPEHLPVLAEKMREQDRDEVAASHNMTPEQALRFSLQHAAEAWVGCHNGEPFCIFGVTAGSLLTGKGIPWMLGTTELKKHWRKFARESKHVVEAWMDRWEWLENWADSRNTVAIGWLGWLGFTIHPAEPHGPFGVLFYRFEKRRD